MACHPVGLCFLESSPSKVRVQFTLLIDEGCRFRIGKVMRKGPGGVSGEQMIQFCQECWKPVFGKPHKLRVDPAGPWRSYLVDDYFSREVVRGYSPAQHALGPSPDEGDLVRKSRRRVSTEPRTHEDSGTGLHGLRVRRPDHEG